MRQPPISSSNALAVSVPTIDALQVLPLAPIVFIVDDDLSVCEMLEAIIGDAGWRSRTLATATALASEPGATVPSCLILGVSSDDHEGIRQQERLAVERGETPVVCIAEIADVSTTVRVMRAGAVDVLTRPVQPEHLRGAIRHALGRSETMLRHFQEIRVLRDRYASLKPRERQVMGLVVSGLLNKQVGGELGISENTVKVHRSRMMHKMNARSLAGLVKVAGRLKVGPFGEAH